MKKKLLCVSLVLMMCLMAAMPTFADNQNTGEIKSALQVSGDLYHVTGSQYTAWARVLNPALEHVSLTMGLYDANNNLITMSGKTSSDAIVKVSSTVTLTSGTYVMKIWVTGNTVSRLITVTCNI